MKKKLIVAAIAASALALAPLTSASAFDVTVGSTLWDITDSYFGVNDAGAAVDNGNHDAFDGSYLALSIDDGATFNEYECRDEALMSSTTIGSGKVVTCDELVTVQTGLNVRGFAYIYPDGLNAATTYKITNTTSASIPFKWFHNHNYGNGVVSNSTFSSVFSTGSGTVNPSEAAAVAWGPTTQACSAASGADDGDDNMAVTSESCTLAAGASMGITLFQKLGTVGGVVALDAAAAALYVSRNADATLAAGMPSGLTNGNWGITGTLNVSTVPAAADPFDPTETMTLTGDAVLGSYMTVAFKAGVDPVGDYYDVWMCPNKDVKPIDEVNEGDCIAVTFWNRGVVASYDQSTSAKTMTWLLSNESQPGLIAQGGANYLDGSGEPINMDPPSEDGGWCAYEGWYMIVQDYIDGDVAQTGAHSNWSPALGAAGCSEPAAGGAALPDTGLNGQQTSLIAAFGLFALLAGLGIAVNRRRGADSL